MLTIIPIDFSGIRTLPYSKEMPIFECQYNPFEDEIKLTLFEKWMQESNFGINQISRIVSDDKNLISSKDNHSIYSISNSDEYLIRILTLQKDEIAKILYCEAEFFNIQNKDFKINSFQQVALIRLKNSLSIPIDIQILKI